MQTAELADFGAPTELSPAITFFVYEEDGRCDASRALLAVRPAAGTNTALVSHAGNVCPPLSSLGMGGAALYRPDGAGGTAFVAELDWDDWATLP